MSNPVEAEAREVCVVDDDLSVLKSMHYLLASEGFKVRTFNKAADFLAHASTHDVPVVVTDIWMDQVTGLEVLARLCAISPKTRVIVITAREDLGRTRHRNGNRPGPLFHEAVRRRKIHRGGSRRSR
jgi:FixJ family two-component response regulator